MKILLIEDELPLAREIIRYLSDEQVTCSHVALLEAAREQVSLYEYDIVLLDVGLPDGNGLELIKDFLRLENIPGLIIISAKDSLDDRLSGLDAGADDYLTKPFHLAELHSRIRSVFRRRKISGKKSLQFGDLEIWPDEFRTELKGEALDLSPREMQILTFLAENPGKILSRAAIAEHVWGDHADAFPDFDFIYSHIKNLRKKLAEGTETDFIRAVYGVGYKFQPE